MDIMVMGMVVLGIIAFCSRDSAADDRKPIAGPADYVAHRRKRGTIAQVFYFMFALGTVLVMAGAR